MVTIYAKGGDVGIDVGKDVGKKLRRSIAEVYKLIQNKPELTYQEIVKITGYT